MTVERAQLPQQGPGSERPTTAEIIERLSRFEGPPEQFLVTLLAVQCHLAEAEGGAILRIGADARVEVLAIYPPLSEAQPPPVWLAQSAESALRVISSGTTAVRALHEPDELYGQPARRQLVMVPLRGGSRGGIRGLAAFVIAASDPATVATARERLELTTSLLSLYEMRLTLQRRQLDLRRLQVAMECLSAVNEHDRFAGAAMALCNELAARFQCERVSFGVLKGRYVHMKAMSHTEKFSRKMKLVQDIESAMEECLDQDVEIIHPAEPQATYVSRAAAQLSSRHGPTAICSLPLRRAGEPQAVLTLERSADRTFTIEQIETLRLTCELCTARLLDLYEHDRWVGARAAASTRKALAAVVGPKHTWLKVAAIAVLAAAVLLIFAEGQYNATAPFVLQPTLRQVVPAPFDGYLKEVFVEPGDRVEAGRSVLATLDTAELKLQLAAAKAELAGYLKQRDAAMRDGKTAEAQIAQAQADRVTAKIDLLEYQIRQAKITATISGLIVSGDLKRQIGAPVKTGDVLFEVAPLQSLRAELFVPENEIAEVKVGQHGELATASYPQRRVEFVVERINPVAELNEQRNVFRVRVRLLQTYPWMRPGMEGAAKIHIGKRNYAWLWTHRLVNWLRMKLWL